MIYRVCKARLCGMHLLPNEDSICDVCKSGIRYIMKKGDEERIG